MMAATRIPRRRRFDDRPRRLRRVLLPAGAGSPGRCDQTLYPGESGGGSARGLRRDRYRWRPDRDDAEGAHAYRRGREPGADGADLDRADDRVAAERRRILMRAAKLPLAACCAAV